MRGRKQSSKGQQRSSSGSSSEGSLEDDSLHVSDLHGGGKQNGSSSRTNEKPLSRMNKSMGDIPFKASDLGSLLAQQKEIKRRGGASVVSEFVDGDTDEPQDDIFSKYTWTTSRQDRSKVQVERKLLNETLRQGTFLKVFESYITKSKS